jgi:hypothetical protein
MALMGVAGVNELRMSAFPTHESERGSFLTRVGAAAAKAFLVSLNPSDHPATKAAFAVAMLP